VTTHAFTSVVYDTAAMDWAPLERFLTAATERGVDAPSADEFMWMGRCQLADGPIVHLYKHAESRRYLNLDHAGFSYRYHSREDPGRYEPFESPLAALDQVIGRLERDARGYAPQWATPARSSPAPSLTP
jgi:hypothetical protein